MTDTDAPLRLLAHVANQKETLVSFAQRLVTAASPNPPGNTRLVADVATSIFRTIPGAEVNQYESAPGIVNVVARISSGRTGKRLVFNGHLDTYPLCEHLGWTVDPLGGLLKEGRLYGRGVSDMKGGIAASIVAAKTLAEHRDLFSGEISIALAGDEETMGELGTQWLLDNVEGAKGDAVVCGDAGSPNIIRFGEKGLLWFEVRATGKSSHGAHVHKGVNAIDRLRNALDVVSRLEKITVSSPQEVDDAITNSHTISEAISGVGESHTLRRVTVNIGVFHAGELLNLMPSEAYAQGDIRLPIGVSVDQITTYLNDGLGPLPGIEWRILRSYDPTYTSPSHSLVHAALSASSQVLNDKISGPVANMRVGASDTRLYRRAGIPAIVVGCTPNNMGAADEYVEVDELVRLAQIHTLIAYQFLTQVD